VRVLVVEDESAVAESVRAALARDGWAVDVVHDGHTAVDWATTYPYDLIVLDLVLPGIDGFEVCRRLRERGCPAAVLMLTALDEVEQRVQGLDSGADDYLTKPFAMSELLARTRALRRRSVGDRHPLIRVADLELDPTRLSVTRHGSAIRITAREYSLLEFLARHPGQVFSQDQLIDSVWDADYSGGSNVVEVFIRSLRRKIDDGRRDGLIETIRGAGYRLRS
jgi:two-component system OmpR family response regulator